MEALLVSTLVVALGEIGDKTQLLALVLAARGALRPGTRPGLAAVPPLANGSSQPSIFNVAANARLLGYETQIDEAPFLYLAVFLVNAASLVLPGSNLTNLIVLGRVHQSGGSFAATMALPWLAVIGTEYAVFRRFFATAIAQQRADEQAHTPGPPADPAVRRAVVISQAMGDVGTPSDGHRFSADSIASDATSSASSRSLNWRTRIARSRP